MIICVESAEVMRNHWDSSFAKYLIEKGFTDTSLKDFNHRVGPWVWVDLKDKTFKYCAHFGCGPGEVFADVHFNVDEFKAIYAAVETARVRMNEFPHWPDRVKREEESR